MQEHEWKSFRLDTHFKTEDVEGTAEMLSVLSAHFQREQQRMLPDAFARVKDFALTYRSRPRVVRRVAADVVMLSALLVIPAFRNEVRRVADPVRFAWLMKILPSLFYAFAHAQPFGCRAPYRGTVLFRGPSEYCMAAQTLYITGFFLGADQPVLGPHDAARARYQLTRHLESRVPQSHGQGDRDTSRSPERLAASQSL